MRNGWVEFSYTYCNVNFFSYVCEYDMRKILIILLVLCTLTAAAAPRGVRDIPNVQRVNKAQYTSNPDGILSPAAVARIDSICASLRQRAIAQVAVVAVDEIDGDDVFDFAVELFDAWGVGTSDKNNGLGILLVRNRHEIRFVTGGGLEGVLPDAICKRIQMRYMLPAFRADDYSAGMVAGVETVGKRLDGSELDLGEGDTASDEELPAWAILVIVFGFIIVPLAVILGVYYYQKRCPRCHHLSLVQQSQQELELTQLSRLIEYTYVCSKCGMVVKRQARSQRNDNLGGGAGGVFMGGGGFGGGSSGGGFGGGSFSGGGAGSRW